MGTSTYAWRRKRKLINRDELYGEEDHARARRNLKRIACVGKERFDSRAVAEQVARRRSAAGKRSEAYKCRGCGKWHVGMPPR